MHRRHFLKSAAALPLGALARRASAGPSGLTLSVLGTFSGSSAMSAQDALDGAMLALKDLGVRLANQEVRVSVDDDKGAAGAALAHASRIASAEPADVVLTALSQPALLQVVPVLAGARIFVLNLGQAPQDMADSKCGPWLFDLAGEETGAEEAAGMMFSADHVRRLVVVGPSRTRVDGTLAALSGTFHGDIVGTIVARRGSPGYAAEIAKIRGLSADAVYSLLTGGVGAAFVRSWGDGDVQGRPRLYGSWQGFERTYLSAMGDAALGVATAGTWAADLDNAQNHRMVSGYETEYGRPPTTWSSHGYDAISLLDAALKQVQGKTTDADALRDALRRTEFPSTRGGLRFNTNQFPVLTYWRREVVRDAKGRPVSEVRGTIVRDWRGHSGGCPMRWDAQAPAAMAPVQKKKKP